MTSCHAAIEEALYEAPYYLTRTHNVGAVDYHAKRDMWRVYDADYREWTDVGTSAALIAELELPGCLL
jgi:hypothetical protein